MQRSQPHVRTRTRRSRRDPRLAGGVPNTLMLNAGLGNRNYLITAIRQLPCGSV